MATTATTHYRSCTLCEAGCGVAVTVEGGRVTGIRGDDEDPFSRGYVCPKATALADLHEDPDRLHEPMVRDGAAWRPLPWDAAYELVASRLLEIRARHGRDSIAVYQGNPTAHNLGLLTYGQLLLRTLGTRNQYSATSLDQLPHMLAALSMFGNQLLMPVPDIERSDLFICLGANPLASNGKVHQFYHPVLRFDGTEVKLDSSEAGGACGNWVNRDGTPVIEFSDT
jgi:anaerobic selenocysteine-containing dehydrogenase